MYFLPALAFYIIHSNFRKSRLFQHITQYQLSSLHKLLHIKNTYVLISKSIVILLGSFRWIHLFVWTNINLVFQSWPRQFANLSTELNWLILLCVASKFEAFPAVLTELSNNQPSILSLPKRLPSRLSRWNCLHSDLWWATKYRRNALDLSSSYIRGLNIYSKQQFIINVKKFSKESNTIWRDTEL